MNYPVGMPSITKLEIASVAETLRNGRLTQGAVVREFERRLAILLHVDHVVACSSGTAALHLALAAIGLGPGDEVLVPDLSFVATANAVAYTGAKPVLVDVDPVTWNMDLSDAEGKVTRNTKVILPVHLYGVPCDMDMLHAFAENHDLEIIEDAAEALGGTWKGVPCGTHGLCGTFSFYANKIITTGEGGAVVTNSEELAESLRLLRGQAQSPIRRFWHGELGFNYRMSDVHASIGLAQLDRLPEFLTERHRVMSVYQKELSGFLQFSVQEGAAPWLFTGVMDCAYTRVQGRMERAGIETRPVFVPMHRLPMYAAPDAQFLNACRISDNGISLPTYPGLTDADVRTIAAHLIGEV